MMKEFLGNLDYVVIIIAAVILYRMIGRPLAFKL